MAFFSSSDSSGVVDCEVASWSLPSLAFEDFFEEPAASSEDELELASELLDSFSEDVDAVSDELELVDESEVSELLSLDSVDDPYASLEADPSASLEEDDKS